MRETFALHTRIQWSHSDISVFPTTFGPIHLFEAAWMTYHQGRRAFELNIGIPQGWNLNTMRRSPTLRGLDGTMRGGCPGLVDQCSEMVATFAPRQISLLRSVR